MEGARILIVEDDPDILELVQYNLQRKGFQVLSSSNGENGLKLAKERVPDLIVLDLMLPGMGGLTVCQQLKEDPRTKDIPVVMLTAKSEENDIITGLEMGADDYVAKPFSPKELVARVRAILRRTNAGTEAVDGRLEVGPVIIDRERHEVFLRGKPVSFTLAEFKLLMTLAQRPGRVFTRDQLLEKITGGDTYLIDRNIDVHVRAIRKKLEEDAELIQTIRGVGYKCREVMV
jgi:phosphate regulon transcriptional regulator PhoB